MNFEKFLVDPEMKILFVDGPTCIGKTYFFRKFAKEYLDKNGPDSILMTSISPMSSKKLFISSMLRFNIPSKPIDKLIEHFLFQLDNNNTKLILIDESQNLLHNTDLNIEHFNFMSYLVNSVDIKIIYVGTEPSGKFNLPLSILRNSLSKKYDQVS
ncbi:TniB family NTP-binding protein [Paenibacillus oryzisoli]|uniref:AAA family ATPase n=1 Tax=Paenibacillus oryzisoli TaxID=1850517 RepID=UPI003D2B6AED